MNAKRFFTLDLSNSINEEKIDWGHPDHELFLIESLIACVQFIEVLAERESIPDRVSQMAKMYIDPHGVFDLEKFFKENEIEADLVANKNSDSDYAFRVIAKVEWMDLPLRATSKSTVESINKLINDWEFGD